MIEKESPITLVPENYFQPFDLREVFANGERSLEVDVGCGDGAFLLAQAARFPNRNFLGIERLLGRVRKVCKKAERTECKNVRVLRVESHYTVRYLLPPASVSILHVSFPDPWPKRRHFHKRLISSDFLNAAHRALVANGELRLTTDDRDYFEWSRKIAAARTDFAAVDWQVESDYPQTDFERRFLAEGKPIHRMLLRKI